MRILHAYNLHRGGGGADNATLATIAVLREYGHEVETFVYDSSDIPPNIGGKIRAFASGMYATKAIKAFVAYLESFKPDIVHTHELYPLISPWILPECSKRGIPTVMSAYDYRLTCPVHNHYYQGKICTKCIDGREYHCVIQNCRDNRMESLAFSLRNWLAHRFGLFTRHVSKFITPTQFTADWLIQHTDISADKVAVVPCLINIPATTVDPAEGQYVAFAGRFVPEKGIDIAIQAARQAGLPLWLAGDTENYPGVAADDDVHFVLTKNPEELASFYRGARMLVMPSIWFETFGIVVGEAMSHGVPVLASRIGALANTTIDGETGLLFEPGNSTELAQKMRILWDDTALCTRLGKGARKHIERTTSPAVHYENILSVYEQLAGNGHAKP